MRNRKKEVYIFEDDAKEERIVRSSFVPPMEEEVVFTEALKEVPEDIRQIETKTINQPTDNPRESLKEFFYEKPEEVRESLETDKRQQKKEKKSHVKNQNKSSFLKDRKKMGVALILLSLFITLFVSPLLNVMTTTEMVTVVVATQNMQKGEKIQSNAISEIQIAKAAILPIHINNKEQALEQYVKTDIAEGEILTSPKVSVSLPFDHSYLYQIPEGKKVMSVTLSELSQNLSGKLMSSDIISIYGLPVEEKQGEGVEPQNIDMLTAEAYPLLQYVRVLAVTNQDGYDLQGVPEKSAYENSLTATVTLLVNEEQAKLLVGIQKNTSIHVALVSRGDEAVAEYLLKLQEKILLEEANKVKVEDENAEGKEEQNEDHSSLG